MSYQITRPDADQLKFTSSKTGEWVLEDYLQNAEIGSLTLAQLLTLLFNPDGTLRNLVTTDSIVAVAHGGTGETTIEGARTSLSLAKSGDNSDITSISGLTTALPFSQGGTSATSAIEALIALGERTSATGSLIGPAGTTAQRDATPAVGYQRFNTTLNSPEVWNGTEWAPMGGGATGAAGNYVFVENDQTVTGDYTLTAGKNAISAGPITINTGITVTVPAGAVWTIV